MRLVGGRRAWPRRAAWSPSCAVIYVHGYNNSFDEAVRRTAMISIDLDFDGAAFLLAWPAQSGMFGYRGDRKRARIAAPFLVEMLRLIALHLPM
jgi:esterase/lipase superfamily enzyme